MLTIGLMLLAAINMFPSANTASINEIQNDPLLRFNYEFIIALNGFYKFHDKTPRRWAEASAMCNIEGAHLIVPNSEGKVNYMMEQIQALPPRAGQDFFIGYSDLGLDGFYFGVDGTPLLATNYLPWLPGKPDQDEGHGHCVAITRRGMLDNVDCNREYYFFCEKEYKMNK